VRGRVGEGVKKSDVGALARVVARPITVPSAWGRARLTKPAHITAHSRANGVSTAETAMHARERTPRSAEFAQN